MKSTCSSCSLQTAVRCIAVINLIWTGILIVIESYLTSQYGIDGIKMLDPELAEDSIEGNPEVTNITLCNYHIYSKYSCEASLHIQHLTTDDDTETEYSDISEDNVISIIWLTSWIIDIGFSILLYKAAATRCRGKCLSWYYFRLAVLIFRILFLTLYAILGLSLLTKIPVMVFFIFRIYSLWVVKQFINELTTEELLNSNSALEASRAAQPGNFIENNWRGDDSKQNANLEMKKALRDARRLSSPFLVYKI